MKAIFTCILSLLFLGYSHAAVSDTLRIDPHALDQLNAGTYTVTDITTISVWIYNDGSNQVSDNIALGFTIGSAGPFLTDTSSLAIQYSNLLLTIPAGDSVLLNSISVNFGNPSFIAGSSIVVIWPIALHNNTVVLDSSSKLVTVIDTGTAAINAPMSENLKVFIFGGQLWVQCDNKNLVKEVRIYDVIGKLMTVQQVSEQTQIPMDKYSTGVYFAEVILNNNKNKVFKVFNAPMR